MLIPPVIKLDNCLVRGPDPPTLLQHLPAHNEVGQHKGTRMIITTHSSLFLEESGAEMSSGQCGPSVDTDCS